MRARCEIAAIGVAVAMAGCQFDPSGIGDGDAGMIGDGGPPADADPDALDMANTPLHVGDVRLAFGQISSSRVYTSLWSGTSAAWRMDESTPMTDGNPVWLVNEVTPGPNAEELMVAQLAAIGGQAFGAFTWDDDGWRPDWTATASLSQSGKRAFDLAVESGGDALVVYATDSMTPSYRTRSSTNGQWSEPMKLPLNDGPGPLPDTNLGVVEWVELSSRSGGDEIALVFSDSNRDLTAMVWNGTDWVISSAKTLETDLKQNAVSLDVANRGFDVAIASSSAQVMVAWAQQSANGALFNHWSAASGWLANADRATGIVSGYPHFIDLAANPQGNLIAGAFFDLKDERVGTAMWTGSQWDDRGELDSQIRDVNERAPGDMPGAVAWLGATGVAICIYADDQEGTLDWARWEATRGWTLETDIAFAGKGFTESVAIASASGPDSDRLVVALSDANLRLFAITFNGASWQLSNQGMPLTTVISNGASVPFSVAGRGR